MRFTITGEWKTNHVLRLIIAIFLVFMGLFWLTNALLFFSHMSFSYDSVVAHYLGQPDEWGGAAVPRSYKVLLELSHAHLFAMGILVLTMTHLLLFVPAPVKVKLWLVSATFLSALLSEASSWLMVYVSPLFAYLKLSMFVLFQLTLGGIVVMLVVALARGSRNGYSDSDAKASAGR